MRKMENNEKYAKYADLLKLQMKYREGLIKDEDLTYEEVINKMKEHKAINMYDFLKKHKTCLKKLKNDALALPLVLAKEYIESQYGSY